MRYVGRTLGVRLAVVASFLILGAGSMAVAQRPVRLPGPAGQFRMVSINTHGLPFAGDGKARHRAIGELLNAYDLALVQEDFAFHKPLGETAVHPFRSPHNTIIFLFFIHLGDGLNRFSFLEFTSFDRIRWEECHGGLFGGQNDCLARKGFSFAETWVGEGSSVDVYNLHADAGESSKDIAARRTQFEQLAEAIREVSPGRAVIVAGDANLRVSYAHNVEIGERFLQETGLEDACDATDCCLDFPSYCDARVDRIWYRSGDEVTLTPTGWWIDEAFSNHPELGRLSDHEAKAAEFRWSAAAPRLRLNR